MPVPKPDGWRDSFDVTLIDGEIRSVTYSAADSNASAFWHDPAYDITFEYYYLDADFAGERIVINDARPAAPPIAGNPGPFIWTLQRARIGGWQVIPSGLP